MLAGGRLIRAILLVVYAASGALALVYEIAWTRRLSVVFGSSHLAAATGLIAFVGGLALGARVFSGRAARADRPLRIYAVLEALIGLFGVASPWILDATQAVYLATWPDDTGAGLGFVLYRFALVAATLVLPTVMMGATVPLMTRVFARFGSSGAAAFGLPLGANTAGAVGGVLLSGFVLLPRLGLQATLMFAGAANVALGLVAWVLERRLAPSRESAVADPGLPAGSPDARPIPFGLLLLVAGVTGACGLGLEIAWTRLLGLVLGSTAYAFAIMLAIYLAGLAIGTIAAARVRTARTASWLLSVALLAFGAATWAGLSVANELPFWFMDLFRRLGDRRDLIVLVEAAIAGALMFVPAVASGAVLPLVMAGRGGGAAEKAGIVYAVNTAAGIVAVALVTFVTIPTFSVRATMAGGAVVLAVTSAVIALAGSSRLRGLPVVALAAMTCAAAIFVTPPWRPSLFATAVYRYANRYVDLSRAELEGLRNPTTSPVLYDEDGFVARVTVVGPRENPSLLLDGKGASAGPDVPTEILLAQLPLLLHGNARRVLVIGQGAGVTTGSALVHPGVEEVVAVELEQKVLDCAPFFRAPDAPATDPRLRVVENDGRNFLLANRARFDVICSQPSNPWVSGAAGLFTAEAYRAGARRLADDGFFCQWLQTYEMSDASLRVLVRTFADEFPHAALFCSTALGNVFLIGSKKEIAFDRDRLERVGTGLLGVEMRRARIESAGSILTLFYFRDDDLRAFAGAGVRNTDDNAFIEFALPHDLFTDRVNEIHATLNGASRGVAGIVSFDRATPASVRSADWLQWAITLKTMKRPRLSREAAAEADRLSR